MTSAARRETPDFDDARFGNGVPGGLRPAGLSFIEMSGLARKGAAERAEDVAEETATATYAPESVPDAITSAALAGSAAARFEELLASFRGDVGARVADETALAPEIVLGDDAVDLDASGHSVDAEAVEEESLGRVMPRPIQAVQKLAEVESLMNALDLGARKPTVPDETIAALQQALVAKPGEVSESVPDALPAEALAAPAREDAAPLIDFIKKRPMPPVIDADAPTPLYTALTPPLDVVPPVADRPPAATMPPGAVAPGYTLLGHGPITWPGVPPAKPIGVARILGVALLLVLAGGVGAMVYAAVFPWSLLPAPWGRWAALGVAVVLGGAALGLLWRGRSGRGKVLADLSKVSQALGVEVIGAIPLVRMKPADGVSKAEGPLWAQLPLLCGPGQSGEMAEAFEILLTNFRFSAPRGSLQSVCFVSVAPGDGLKTVAFNFAAAHALRGQHVLFTTAGHHEAPEYSVHERFDVPMLYCTDAPATGEGYDLAVRLGHALLAHPEARHAAAQAQAVVLVIDPSVVSREMAQRAISLLREVKAPLVGVVVNRVRSGRLRRAYEQRAEVRKAARGSVGKSKTDKV